MSPGDNAPSLQSSIDVNTREELLADIFNTYMLMEQTHIHKKYILSCIFPN